MDDTDGFKANWTWIAAGVVGLAILFGVAYYVAAGRDEQMARQTITNFGAQLQHVSLLSADASSTMAAAYGPYVDPALLQSWQKNPAHAPGRTTSSPWPERIEILGMTTQGQGYVVQGAIILLTSKEKASGGQAGFIPVIMQVVPSGSGWRIVAFQEQTVSTSSNPQ